MKQDYIILRKPALRSSTDMFTPSPSILGGGVPFDLPEQPLLEVEELNMEGIAKVSQHNDVIGLAPNMPTKLISPADIDLGGAAPLSSDNTWGVEAVSAHISPYDGAGTVAAVLDTGIDVAHPAFANITIDQKDFSGDGNGDVHGHGSHCAGTVFGAEVNGKRIGVAPNIDRALIAKVLGNSGGGGTKATFDAIQWALQNGANVISMSLGIDFPGYVTWLESKNIPIDLATSMALEGYRTNILLYEKLTAFIKSSASFNQTCIVVAAAGNENRRFSNPDWDISVAPPAVANGIISVGAVGSTPNGLVHARFSNSGPNVVGPGVDVESARAGTSDLISFNGTSMATPHVAGVALLWAQKLLEAHSLTPFNLEARLVSSGITSPLAAGFQAADIGLGIVQAPQ